MIEVCRCGHLKTQHNSNPLYVMTAGRPFGPATVFIEGHGACKLCGCEKFTWHTTLDNQTYRDEMNATT